MRPRFACRIFGRSFVAPTLFYYVGIAIGLVGASGRWDGPWRDIERGGTRFCKLSSAEAFEITPYDNTCFGAAYITALLSAYGIRDDTPSLTLLHKLNGFEVRVGRCVSNRRSRRRPRRHPTEIRARRSK